MSVEIEYVKNGFIKKSESILDFEIKFVDGSRTQYQNVTIQISDNFITILKYDDLGNLINKQINMLNNILSINMKYK